MQQMDFNARERVAANEVSIQGDILGWARIAGLVEIHTDGSWSVTEAGKARLLELEGTGNALGASPTSLISVSCEPFA